MTLEYLSLLIGSLSRVENLRCALRAWSFPFRTGRFHRDILTQILSPRFPDGKSDPEYVQSFRALWNEIVQQGLTVAAFCDDPAGGKPILAGVNMLMLCQKDDATDLDHFVKVSAQQSALGSIASFLCAHGDGHRVPRVTNI